MKVVYASDLHLEFDGGEVDLPETDGADLVVLAGDTAIGLDGLAWAARVDAPAVVYVPGNHEFYGHDRPTMLANLRDTAAEIGHVHLLDNDALDLEANGRRWRVLGATLWTDFALGPSDIETAKRIAEEGWSDFQEIRERWFRFRADDAARLNSQSRKFLERELEAANRDPDLGGVLVVTHHAPLDAEFTPQRYVGGLYNPCCASNWPEIFEKYRIAAWIAGHTHMADVDCTIGGCRLLSRQHGYPGELWEPGAFKFGRAELQPGPDRTPKITDVSAAQVLGPA